MTDSMDNYPRDLVGYGRDPVAAAWPGSAQIAVQFVINYEEGAENCVLHGDAASEAFLSEIVGAVPITGARHVNMESIYEYGSRAGFWRLHRLFTARQVPVTVFGVAMALARNPEAVGAMQDAGWEIASHGYRWIDYQHIAEDLEREHLLSAIDLHAQVTGHSVPVAGIWAAAAPRARRLVADEGGFVYNSDTYADDLPYWDASFAIPQLMIPYTLDANDMRFTTAQGFNSGDQFYAYLKDAFDVLYAEGEQRPRMMSVGLHCRIAGRPGRAAAVERFLDYVLSRDDVWLTPAHRYRRALGDAYAPGDLKPCRMGLSPEAARRLPLPPGRPVWRPAPACWLRFPHGSGRRFRTAAPASHRSCANVKVGRAGRMRAWPVPHRRNANIARQVFSRFFARACR